MTITPALVTLHVWGVPPTGVPRALVHMGTQRRRVRNYPGVTFAKLMGTGSGNTFTVTDSDPSHWALLTCWDAEQAAASFERSRLIRAWDSRANERLRVELMPLSSNGRWSGREPFGQPSASAGDHPVAALTRARLRAYRAIAFWRAVPPVSAALHRSPGLALALGIGEAPIGLQGTFSIWRSSQALSSFAYGDANHRAVIEQTREIGWYAEELFARFALLNQCGTYRGRELMMSS